MGVTDEIILSLEKLNKVINIDTISQVGTLEAGCVLQDVNNILEKQGFMLPIDLGAKGSCQLGKWFEQVILSYTLASVLCVHVMSQNFC